MKSLISMKNLFVKIRDVIRDLFIFMYVIWMIRSEDLRSKMEERILKMDMKMKDREDK